MSHLLDANACIDHLRRGTSSKVTAKTASLAPSATAPPLRRYRLLRRRIDGVYEYLIFEDPKAAGFEPMLVRSGYNANDMGAYMELRDDRVCFFVRRLARGKHSVAYRLRAEIPGKFSALPARGYAMYAPELKGNSDEIKLAIED